MNESILVCASLYFLFCTALHAALLEIVKAQTGPATTSSNVSTTDTVNKSSTSISTGGSLAGSEAVTSSAVFSSDGRRCSDSVDDLLYFFNLQYEYITEKHRSDPRKAGKLLPMSEEAKSKVPD